MDRQELTEREAAAWRAFLDEVEAVPPDRRTVEGVVPGWSVKDLVHHCAGWASFAVEHLAEVRGGPFIDPFEGVPDEHWDRVSQEMIDESRRMPFTEVLLRAEDTRARNLSTLAELPSIDDEAAHFLGEETFEHYDEHTAEIRAFRERG